MFPRAGFRFAISKSIVFGVLSLAVSAAANANGSDCDCGRYAQFTHFQSLSQQVATLGSAVLSQDGRSFENAMSPGRQDEREVLKLRVLSEQLIPETCKKELLGTIDANHGVTAVARINVGMTSAKATPIQSARNIDGSPFSLFHLAEHAMYLRGRDETSSRYKETCIPDPGGRTCTYSQRLYRDILFRDFLNGPDSETLVQFNEIASKSARPISLSELKQMRFMVDFMSSSTLEEALAKVSSKKDGLSDDEFLDAMSHFLGYLSSRTYDDKRAAASPTLKAQNAISADQVFTSLKEAFLWGGDIGICRDNAAFGALVISRRPGFSNTHTIMRTLSAAPHVTVVTQRNKNGVRMTEQIDGHHRAQLSGVDGGLALVQANQDVSTNYRLFDSKSGRMVADIASPSGELLSEAAGFGRLDPLSRPQHSLIGSGIALTRDQKLQSRVFVGQDAADRQFIGAAASYRYGDKTSHFPGKVGLVAGAQRVPAAGTSGSESETVPFGYLQAEQHAQTGAIPLTRNSNVAFDQSLTTIAMGSKSTNDKYPVMPQGDIRATSEASYAASGGDGKFKTTVRVGAQIVPGSKDVQRVSPSALIPVFNHAYVSADASVGLGNYTLFGGGTAVVSQLGTRGQISGGIAKGEVAAQFDLSGRIKDKTPTYEPSTLRRLSGHVYYRPSLLPNARTTLGVGIDLPVEGAAELRATRMMSDIRVEW